VSRLKHRGRAYLTAIDVLTLVAVIGLVLLVVVPQSRVRGLLDNEDVVIADLADIERREEAHRASGKTDADRNGRGEYAALGTVLGDREGEFQRIEGTDVWRRGGYYFTVLLPDNYYLPVAASAPQVSPKFAEVAKLIVAWPAEPGRTGMRAYARWPDGTLFQHGIDGYPYSAESPFPKVPLVQSDAKGPRPADRYDREDWLPPRFSSVKTD
jgi:hypothetical protein